MLRGLVVVCLFAALGELLERTLGLPLPGPVLGLVAFVVALRGGLVQRAHVHEACAGLTAHMALFLVPVAVAVFGFALPAGAGLAQWLAPIVVASAVSTVVVFAVVGLAAQRLARD